MRRYYFFVFFVLSVGLNGCASLPVEPVYTGAIPSVDTVEKEEIAPAQQGIYHMVGRGQTLWRIAKTYGVAIDEIVRSNNIIDPTQIEKGQKLFVPRARAVEDIVIESESEEDEFVWPLNGLVISRFRDRTDVGYNKGIDIKGSNGDAVKAARRGRVVFADDLFGYGKTIILKHDDGYYSVYANNAKLMVALNDLVFKNKTISYIGQTGDIAYLHFEIRRKSIEDNPLYYLPK